MIEEILNGDDDAYDLNYQDGLGNTGAPSSSSSSSRSRVWRAHQHRARRTLARGILRVNWAAARWL